MTTNPMHNKPLSFTQTVIILIFIFLVPINIWVVAHIIYADRELPELTSRLEAAEKLLYEVQINTWSLRTGDNITGTNDNIPPSQFYRQLQQPDTLANNSDYYQHQASLIDFNSQLIQKLGNRIKALENAAISSQTPPLYLPSDFQITRDDNNSVNDISMLINSLEYINKKIYALEQKTSSAATTNSYNSRKTLQDDLRSVTARVSALERTFSQIERDGGNSRSVQRMASDSERQLSDLAKRLSSLESSANNNKYNDKSYEIDSIKRNIENINRDISSLSSRIRDLESKR